MKMGTNVLYRSEVFAVIFTSFVAVSVSLRKYGVCNPETGDGIWKTFRCFDGALIERKKYCDRQSDCKDNSDEKFCIGGFVETGEREGVFPSTRTTYNIYKTRYSTNRTFFECTYNKYISTEWLCDGIFDCSNGYDETICPSSTLRSSLNSARERAIQWLYSKTRSASATESWGPYVDKTAVALFLSDPTFIIDTSSEKQEMTNELTIQLLLDLKKNKLHDTSSTKLASLINAFLVTCIDPRDFYGFNFVEELKTRVDKKNLTNPYVFLALCNAGEQLTESDIKKIIDVFESKKYVLWTDVQAFALMALSCARKPKTNVIYRFEIENFAKNLKKLQSENGAVENLLTTLLVMQALYAAENNEDTRNFDEKKALSYILQNQKPDGSFGSHVLTHYALAVLSCKSMVDINNNHCVKGPKEEEMAGIDLSSFTGPKVPIRYSVWIGSDRTTQRTLSMKIPANTSFSGAMQMAAKIDARYKFEYVLKDGKPYITTLFGIMRNPETEEFWFPCIVENGTAKPWTKSTAEMIPKNNEHLVMWYKKGSLGD